MKLLTYPENKNAYKALIAAEYVGVQIDVPSSFQMGVDNKTPDFLSKNPFGKVPVLCTDKGAIFESNAIARYVARLGDAGLFGSTLEEQAAVDQWIDFSTLDLDAPMFSWVVPLLMPQFVPYDKKKEKAAIETVQRNLETLNAYLADKTFLVNDSITLADIIVACNLLNGFVHVFDEAFLKPYPHVKRYYMTLVHQAAFVKVMGEPKLCEKPLTYTPPKKGDKKAEAKGKEEKPAEEEKAPKEEKPAKEKPKTWLDLLPPTPMPLDSFKRLYSNCPVRSFRETFVPRMWEGGAVPNSPTDEVCIFFPSFDVTAVGQVFSGMDVEGYSFWFANYKYDDENTVNFMVSNKVGGFLQRMEFARKFAFGVLLILKDEEKGIFPIRGLWIFRGPEVPEVVVKESDDMELYTLTRVDLSDAEQKKRVEDIICEEETIDGMELVDSKVFK